MNESRRMSRRRALHIVASAAGVALAAGSLRAAHVTPTPVAHTWRGIALGARASITLCHHDPEQARRLLRLCVAELRRLEDVFSLYRRASTIVQLNRQGFVDRPPPDFVHLLSMARAFGELTKGAFDPTVQPLWTLYATHFARPSARSEGPERAAIDNATALVGYGDVSVTAARVAFGRPGMAVTLNGIAQGYITDRVTGLLRNEGIEDVLVDLGEIRGLGHHPDGRPWTVGVEDPHIAARVADTLILENQAVASSAGSATRFDENGRHHHLFDPRAGASTRRYRGVTVTAPTATVADALSTGFASMDMDDVKRLLQRFPSVTARMTMSTGVVVTLLWSRLES